MIRYIIFSALMFCGTCLAYAQDVEFNYDFNGNRIHQEVMTLKASTATEFSEIIADTISHKIQKEDHSYEFVIYPNPFQNVLNITVNGELPAGTNKVELFTVSGVSIYSGEIEVTTNKLDFSQFSRGIYFLTITGGKESDSWKIVKQ